MRILVAYASKTGVTQKAAQQLAQRLLAGNADVELYDLCENTPSPEGYDAVAVGGPIRMGSLHMYAARYLVKHEEALLKQPLGLFICRCGTDDLQTLLSRQLSAHQRLLSHAAALDALGGDLDWSQLKGFDRMIVKLIAKGNQGAEMKTEGIVPERVQAFADALLKAAEHD